MLQGAPCILQANSEALKHVPWLQEDDVIGLLSTTNIADLQPLGDRVLIQVPTSYDTCKQCFGRQHSISNGRPRMLAPPCPSVPCMSG